MSYILDALKKSEQERQKQIGPTLQSIHRPYLMAPRRGKTYWFLILLCIVLSVGLALSGFYYLENNTVVGHRLNFSEKRLTEEEGSSGEQGPTSSKTQLVEESLQSNSVSLIDSQTPDPNKAITDEVPEVLEFWELPDPVQQEIPALTFSFHVYSENADKRAIIINRRRLKQGDTVSHGLTLVKITVDGVVLNWKRFYFRINVVEQW